MKVSLTGIKKLQFKRDSEAEIKIIKKHLEIKKFYSINLLQKLSLMKEMVDGWHELVESVMIDWNYEGAVSNRKLLICLEKINWLCENIRFRKMQAQ